MELTRFLLRVKPFLGPALRFSMSCGTHTPCLLLGSVRRLRVSWKFADSLVRPRIQVSRARPYPSCKSSRKKIRSFCIIHCISIVRGPLSWGAQVLILSALGVYLSSPVLNRGLIGWIFFLRMMHPPESPATLFSKLGETQLGLELREGLLLRKAEADCAETRRPFKRSSFSNQQYCLCLCHLPRRRLISTEHFTEWMFEAIVSDFPLKSEARP